jgi:type IX secretion system PorP/SprF family membrane protein
MKILFLFITLLSSQIIFAQDPQFSQFYNAPLLLNPSFAGTVENSRASVNYRNQWPLIGSKSFTTYAVSLDHYSPKIKSGIGFSLLQSALGETKLKTSEFHGVYSFHIQLNEKFKLIPSLSAGVAQRSIDFNALIFPDQYTNNGFTGQSSAEPIIQDQRLYLDVGAGLLLHNEHLWLGASAYHLNKPNTALNAQSYNQLPIKLNVHMGAKIYIDHSFKGRSSQFIYKDKAIMPSILYKLQGDFDQLDFGSNVVFEPIVFGVYYRGLPIKNYNKEYINNESINFMFGYSYKNFSVSYSYDFVISKLSYSSGGAHEVSLVMLFGKEKVPTHHRRKIPCPTFYQHKLYN